MFRIRCGGLLLVLTQMLMIGSASASESTPWPMVIGHRGLGAEHTPEPENSLAALLGAFVRGVSAVEFDVQLTRDNQVVLAHDPDLDRMTNGEGCVSEKTLAQIKRLKLRDGNGRVVPGLVPATMEEALTLIRVFDRADRPFLADIHIKVYDGVQGDIAGIGTLTCNPTPYRALTDQVLAIVERMGLLDRVIFTSFDSRVLNRIKRTRPQAKVGALTLVSPRETIFRARGRYDYVVLNHLNYTQFDVMLAHAYGLKALAWSPEERGEMSSALDDGFDGVISDDVPAAVRLKRDRTP